jgi:hypothetical protein
VLASAQWLWHSVASLAVTVALEDVTQLACAVCRSGSDFTVALFLRAGTSSIVGLADTSDVLGIAVAVVCEIDL